MSLFSLFTSTGSWLKRTITLVAGIALLGSITLIQADELTIFSKEKLIIGARAVVNAGSIQSETDVLVGHTSSIKGAVYSNGTAYIRYNAHIYSDLLTASTQTLESGAVIDGYKRENTEIPQYSLQTKNVCTGCYNLTIPCGYYCNLQPGYYNDITVQSGGKLYLAAGTYNFRTLNVCYNARVYVNISSSQYTTVNVRDYMNVGDYGKISLICATNTPSVNFYTNQCSTLYIGKFASVEGCFTAPYAEFTLLPYGSFTGSVNAKRVTIYQDAAVNGELARDRDGDDVPDVIEYQAGTSPTNASSKPAVLVEGSWQNRTAYGEQVQVYDFSHFAGYEQCDAIPVYLPENNITGDYAIIYTYIQSAGSTINDNKYSPDVGGFEIRFKSNCYGCLTTPIPISNKLRGNPENVLRLYYKPFNSSTWRIIPIEQVYYGAVTANIGGEGTYVVAKYTATYYVSKDYTASIPLEKKYKTLEEALTAAALTAVTSAVTYITEDISTGDGTLKEFSKTLTGTIFTKRYFTISTTCNNGTSDYPVTFTYDIWHHILQSDVAGCEGTIDFATKAVSLKYIDPVKNAEKITARFPSTIQNAVILVAKGDYTPNTYFDVPPYIDLIAGFPSLFNGSTMEPSQAKPREFITKLVAKDNSSDPIMYIGHNWDHGYDVVVDGFTFEGKGLDKAGDAVVGAIDINHRYNTGQEKNTIRNCVFINNVGQLAGAVSVTEAAKVFFDNCIFINNTCNAKPEFNPLSGAGAVHIRQYEDGSVEAEFYSCVFSGNTAKTGIHSGTITSEGTVISLKYPLKIVNCTFNNNGTDGTAATNVGSVCNATKYWNGSSHVTAPAVVLNSILYSNATVKNKEVYGILSGTTKDVTYIVDDGITSKTLNEYGISYTAIHDDVIGKLSAIGNIELSTTNKPGFTTENTPEGSDGTFGTADDGLNLSMSSPLRKRAQANGLQEYSDASIPSYYRPEFSDATIRVRLNRNIDEVGAYEKYIRIMCVGDDNTVGWSLRAKRLAEDTENNYRKYLKTELELKNYECEFVGSVEGIHEGAEGKKIDYFTGVIANKIDLFKPINLIIFLGGTTDIAAGDAPATVFDRLYKENTSSFVYNSQNKLNNDTRLLISLIPPVISTPATESNFVTLNNLIKDQSWSAVSPFIEVVNPVTQEIYDPSGTNKYPQTFSDFLLTDAGYSIFAQKYLEKIDAMYK